MKRYIKSSYKMQDKIADLRKSNIARGNLEFVNTVLPAMEKYFVDNPGYSMDTLFGVLKHNDERFEDIFQSLKDQGYSPRNTYYMDRVTTCALTIDVPSRNLPEEVVELVEAYPDLDIRHVSFHKGTRGYKAKFEIWDTQYKRIHDNVYDTYVQRQRYYV